MHLKHAMGLAVALLPAACAPGLGGFDPYAGPPGAYAAPYPAAEPFYRPVGPPPLSPYGVGPGYGGYDRDRGRREWERRREHEARDAHRRDRERQEFDRRRFEQTRREEAFRREQFRRERFRHEDMHRHEPRPDFYR